MTDASDVGAPDDGRAPDARANARSLSDPIDESEMDGPSEQEAGAGANNPARPSETGGNSIEIGDTLQYMTEIDPSQP